MAGKLQTLRNQREISQLFRRGRRRRGRFMDVVTLRRDDSQLRALFVTSRKVGGAVVRNRVRRRMREALRALTSEIAGGVDVAFIAFSSAAEAGYWDLLSEMQRSLTKAGLTAPRNAP